jgi:hypothetical protein
MMTTPRIIPATALQPSLATIVVKLPDRTIRSRALMVQVVVKLPDRTIRSRALMIQVEAHGVVKVAFASGDVLTLSSRTAVGIIDPPKVRKARRAS